MELWQLYLLVTAPKAILGFCLCAAMLVALGVRRICIVSDHKSDLNLHAKYPDTYEHPGDKPTLNPAPYFAGAFVSILLALATPTANHLYTIVGGYYITNIEDMKDLPPNVVKAANKFLKDFGAADKKD